MARLWRRQGLWWTLAALTLLLAVLAALQYRWTGELGRAEAERRRAQLDRSARRFVAGLYRELVRVMIALFADTEPAGETPTGPSLEEQRVAFLRRLAAFSRSQWQPLVSGIFVLSRRSSDLVVLESCVLDNGDCRPVPWTSRLDPLRRRLLRTQEEDGLGTSQRLVFPCGEARGQPLAVAVPYPEPPDAAGAQPRRTSPGASSWNRPTSGAMER